MPAQFKNQKSKIKSQKSKGFTLVELLVVISIISILSVVGLVAFSTAQTSARDSKRKQDLQAIVTALELHKQSTGKYPKAGSCAYGDNCYVSSTAGESWIPALVPKYINRLPVDPTNNNNFPWIKGNYTYSYGNVSLNGDSYDLTTQLENTNDPQRCGVKRWRWSQGIWCNSDIQDAGQYTNQIYEASPDR